MTAYDVLGRVGLPAPIAELVARDWDVVVVGGGHNGLAAAAYLARAGRSVLVLERRDHVGGACTLERPFADERFVMSPCAYLVGLLHPLVIDELDLVRHGYRTFVVDPTQWTPFEDGSSLFQWHDEEKTAASVDALSPRDVEGFLAYEALFDRITDRLRRGPRGDVWIGAAPGRAELEALFADDAEAREVVLDVPIADVVEQHVKDERLRTALHGQGVIGTFAGPREPGTAWIHAHHSLGLIGGWSFVEGGMGRVSFCLADSAREHGAAIAAGVPVAAIVPGEGVLLEDGGMVRARAIVSNADPVRTLALVDAARDGCVDAALREQVGGWRITSPVIKLNCALSRLPSFPAASGDTTVYRAQVEIGRSIDDTQAACDAARRGVPAPEWCELYFQTPYDPSVAPPGAHTMSVFAQFVPYELASGTWDERRDEIADAALGAIARFAPDVADCVVDRQVLGPTDVEEQIGLTGGHIFQGECLPDQMWDRRFEPRFGAEGVYLCGAATHPGGSVIAINGRRSPSSRSCSSRPPARPSGYHVLVGSSTGPSESPDVFVSRVVSQIVSDDYEHAWETLYPPHQRIAGSDEYVSCELRSPVGWKLRSISVVRVKDHTLRVPGDSDTSAAKAVTLSFASRTPERRTPSPTRSTPSPSARTARGSSRRVATSCTAATREAPDRPTCL